MKDLKIIILFIVVLLGCSKRYLARTEEEVLDRKIINSWESLNSKIIEQANHNFTLNFQIKDYVGVRDSVEIIEIYKRGLKKKDGSIKQDNSMSCAQVSIGAVIGGCGCLAGTYFSYMELAHVELLDAKTAFEIVSCIIGGTVLTVDGFRQFHESSKAIPTHIREDTVCIDSVSLSKEEVNILVEKTDFGKIYWTDENGDIELKFNEIIPESTVDDSMFNLIIQYEELFDTVNVNIMKMGD